MKDFLDIQPKISGCNWYREIVGFAYGNTSLPGQYCNILIEKEFHLEEKHKWLSHCFEFVELAIHQSYRKQGPGKNTAKLTTQVNNIAARSLYESLNRKVLKEPFFPAIRIILCDNGERITLTI